MEQAVREQLDDIITGEISGQELARVKAQVVSGDVYERDSMFYQAMVLGIFETTGLPWRLADEYVGAHPGRQRRTGKTGRRKIFAR